MLAFPGMLVQAAEKAGMKVPSDPEEFAPEQFPHFYVFCNAQLGRAMTSPNEHWTNAEIVAKIPDEKIRTITWPELLGLGFSAP